MTDMFQEKWMKGVAVTATCLAVMTAIAAARGTACVSKTQLLTAAEGSKWAYYQAKSIKQNLSEVQKNLLEASASGAADRAVYEAKIAAAAEEMSRYNEEKESIRKEAEETAATNRKLAVKGNFFSAAVVFFQIAIMLSSVAALLKKRFMWIIGLVFGAVAAVLLGYGLFLQPLLF